MAEGCFGENTKLRRLIWIFHNYEFVCLQTVLFWGCVLWHFLKNDNFSLRRLEALFEYTEKDVFVTEFQSWQELIGTRCISVSLNPFLKSNV